MSSEWKIYVDYGSGWVELTDWGGSNLILEGLEKKEQLHDKELRGAKSSVMFMVSLDTTLATNLLAATEDVKCEVYKDSDIWFRGYVRHVTEYRDDGTSGSTIEMEVYDWGYYLDRGLSSNITYEDKDLCDTSDESNSIIHLLLSEAGYPASYIGITLDIPVSIPIITFEAGTNYSEIIGDILWDYHHVYNVRTDGTFVVYNWAPESITPAATFDESNIIEELLLKNDDMDEDQVRVIYNEFQTDSGTLYKKSDKDGIIKDGEEATVNSLADDDLTWPSSPGDFNYDIDRGKDNERKLLRGRNQSMSYTVSKWRDAFFGQKKVGSGSASVTHQVHTNSLTELQFSIDVPEPYGLFNVVTFNKLDYIKITGTLDFVIEGNKETSIYSTSNSRGRLKEYKATYLYQDDDAKALADALTTHLEYGRQVYVFSSETEADIGDYVTISNTKLNLTTTARIISKGIRRKNDVEVWDYEAIGVAALETQAGSIVSGGYYLGPTPEQLGEMAEIVEAGLDLDGAVKKPIDGPLLDSDWVPGYSGLYLSSEFLGYFSYTDQEWTARIKNDGTFKFLGDADNYIEWDGSKLHIEGDMYLSGDSELRGKVTTGNGITSDNYEAGSAGWNISGDGDAELNEVTVRGTVEADDGEIGGFTIGETRLYGGESAGARIQLNRTEKQFSIYDASDVLKVALGYLGNITGFDSTEYGLYIAPGNKMQIEGGGEFKDGDYLIDKEGAFVSESDGREVVRLGSLGKGDVGLDIGGMAFGSLIGGGDADSSFDETVGGGGSTGTFEGVLGGGNAEFGSDSGLLYKLSDNSLRFRGELEAATGTFTGELEAASGVFTGSVSILDDIGRDIEISSDDGIKAFDTDGVLIHDLPDAAITDNFYAGHYIAFPDENDNKLYGENFNAPNYTWTAIGISKKSNTNIKAVKLKITIGSSSGTAGATGKATCFVRPKGSDWGNQVSSVTPSMGSGGAFDQNIVIGWSSSGVVDVPVGDDDEIEFYAMIEPSDDERALYITQLGVYI